MSERRHSRLKAVLSSPAFWIAVVQAIGGVVVTAIERL
jgi:hypothetical protein